MGEGPDRRKLAADAIVRADLDPFLGSWSAWEADTEPKRYRNDRVHFTARGIDAPYWITAINEVLPAAKEPKSGR